MPHLDQQAARAREQLCKTLLLLEVPADLAWDIARRLPYKVAEAFTKELDRLFHGGPS